MTRARVSLVLALAWMLATAATSRAQSGPPADVEVRAYLKPSSAITTATQFEFVIEVSGEELNPRVSAPEIVGLENLTLLRRNPFVSQSTTSYNGQVSASFRLSYPMRPDGVGPARIPEYTVSVNGRAYRTSEIRFDVSAPPQAPSPPETTRGGGSENVVFAVTQLGTEEVWVGEPVMVTAQVYSSLAVSSASPVEVPSFSSFRTVPVPLDRGLPATRAQLNGRIYGVWPVHRSLLIPLTSGEQTIEPYTIRIGVQSRRDLFDLFSRGTTVRRATEPVTLRVKPLPAGAPDGFSGAVGRFRVKATLDRGESAVNDAVAFRVVVEGEGSLQAVEPPAWEAPAGVQVYEPDVVSDTEIRNGTLYSRKSWEWVLVPLAPGTIEIPDLRFAYFDTDDGVYRTAGVEPLQLQVAEGAATPFDGPRSDRGVISLDRRDIGFVKRLGTRPLRGPTPPLRERAWFVSLALAPLFWVPFAVWLGRRRDQLQRDRGLARARRARKRALRALTQVRRQQEAIDGAAFHEEVARALVGYVGDRFNRSPSGLTYELADELLAAKGTDEQLRRRFRSCLETCDFARFVPASAEPARREEVLDEAVSLIESLEKAR